MKRYYIVQYCDKRAGWTDMPQTASFKNLEVVRSAESVAHKYMVVTRVIQKPKGWEPNGECHPLKGRTDV